MVLSGVYRFYCTVCNKQVLGQGKGQGRIWFLNGLFRYGCRTFRWLGVKRGRVPGCHLGIQMGGGNTPIGYDRAKDYKK